MGEEEGKGERRDEGGGGGWGGGGGGGSFLNRCQGLCAFTMAEILLSLTIIGVVAAITLPSLTGNINERTWATQKKALYARMSQAFPLLDSINTYDDAESFIAGALNTVTKINNVCSQENLEDCGINTAMIAALNGSTISDFQGTWSELGISVSASDANSDGNTDAEQSAADANWEAQSAAFETGNGESIVLYYNSNCVPDQETAPKDLNEEWFKYVCVNMVYDLNSNKGPNTVGKDIGFMTVFYPTDPVVVSAIPDLNISSGSSDGAGSGAQCNSEEYRFPNKYEAISMALNNRFLTGTNISSNSPKFYSSTKGASASETYTYYTEGMKLKTTQNTIGSQVSTRCVKR